MKIRDLKTGDRIGTATVLGAILLECKCACGNTFHLHQYDQGEAFSCALCIRAAREAEREKTRAAWLRAKADRVGVKSTEPLRNRIRRECAAAIRRGELQRPEACERCKRSIGPIVAHHEDYGQPLAVTWLCTGCHISHHADLRREGRDPAVLHHRSVLAAGEKTEAA